ncbi:ATP-dependent Clp protease ATP-binding subunit [bacterium]|nr:ATP-dependent Clp protease ATP-binding subunit [bacterium]
MINFNLKATGIYQAVKWERHLIFKKRRFFKILFFVLTLAFFSVFLVGVFTGVLSENAAARFFGGFLFSLTFLVFFWQVDLFFEGKLRRPKLKYPLSEALLRPEEFNFAGFLDFEAAKVCFSTLKFAKRKKVRKILRPALLYSLLKSKNKEIDFIFGRGELNLKAIKKSLKKILREIKKGKDTRDDFEDILFTAGKIAFQRGKGRIGVGDILISFAENDPFFQKILIEEDLKKEDIKNLADWFERVEKRVSKSKKFWEYENLLKKGSIGRDWAAGFTLNLDTYSLDLREKLKRTGFREIIGHQKELEQIERILEKTEQNNVLLVGEPGVGRKSIVEGLAQKALLGKGSPTINYKRVLDFDLTGLAAQIRSFEQAETTLDSCFAEAVRAGNVILVIDKFHNFVSEIPKPGTINVSKVLARYLPLSTFQIIAITTYDGLHRIIERNPSLLNLFEKVEVSELSQAETLRFLENYVPFFERKFKRFIGYKALREILRLGARYITDIPFPKKAIDVLDEAMVYLSRETKSPVLLPEHIKKVVSERIEMPLEKLEVREKEILLNLEKLIHQRIIDQQEAVKEISAALRRARAEIQVRNRPIGSFLFLGPTGVGKTETSKALSAIYFKGEEKMIRLDMSEFQNLRDIKRLIGSREQEGLLTTPVRENPFSLILFDEIEKAHPNILNLFLQVLDEGWVTGGDGRKVDFRNTIIIATSNAGAEVIREDIAEDKKLDIIKEDLLDYLLKKGIFRPEFINRFDAIVVFKPLSRENLLDIAQLMLKKLAENLRDKGIEFEITQGLKEKIAELGYSPEFGAREMRRVIQDKVENVLATAILSGKLKRGDMVKVNPKNFSLIITKR